MLTSPLIAGPTQPALLPSTPTLRSAGAAALHAASQGLHRLALLLAEAPAGHRAAATTPVLEFHAEAGAPEGALYVDGQLVGHSAGVTRL